MNKTPFIVDITILFIYIIVANPSFTSQAIHEWLAVILFIGIFGHCVFHVNWICALFHSKKMRTYTVNFIIDVGLLITIVIVAVSGLGMSHVVLPSLGLVSYGYFFWKPLHALTAKMFLAFLLLHLCINRKWIQKTVKKVSSHFPTRATKTNIHN